MLKTNLEIKEKSHGAFHNTILIQPYKKKTSLLRRLQAQTLPNATPSPGKIHPFSKNAVTFEQIMDLAFDI